MLRSLIGWALLYVCLATDAWKTSDDNVVRFDDVDEDGDAKVTYNEFEHWHKKSEGSVSDQKLKTLFQSNDKNGDSALSIAEFVQVASELSGNPVHQVVQIFKKIDLNGDGIITLEESKESGDPIVTRIMEGVFQVADGDHNGQITLNEFATVVENEDKPKTQAEQDKENAQRLLALIDHNADRKLDVQEVHTFANINSKAEMDALMEKIAFTPLKKVFVVTEAEVKEAFAYLDTDHDGYISSEELTHLHDKVAKLVHFKEAPPVHSN